MATTGSGVHGAFAVLEPSFTGDTLASAMGIPPSKQIIRRHLTAELDALLGPARYRLRHGVDYVGSLLLLQPRSLH